MKKKYAKEKVEYNQILFEKKAIIEGMKEVLSAIKSASKKKANSKIQRIGRR